MPKNLQLSLIIPANNAKKLNKTLAKYGSFFSSLKNFPIEIIVVLNSKDKKTLSVVKRYSKTPPFIKSIETPYITGKGGAVSLGFLQASGKIIGYTDSDGAVCASDILKLYKFLVETPQLDGVIGSRIKEKISLKRKMLINTFWLINKIVFGLSYKDTQCGIKLFRNSRAKEVARRLSNTGYAFDVNILLVCKYLNYKVFEVKVKWNEKLSANLHFVKRAFDITKELLTLKLSEISYVARNKSTKFYRTKAPEQGANVLIFSWRDVKHPQMGGSEVYIHQIAKRLAKKHKVILFTSKPGNLFSEDEIDGVKVIRKGGFLTVYVYAFFYYIFSLRKFVDIVIDVENGIPFFTPLYCRKPKILVVHHIHKKQWFKQFAFPLASIGYLLERFLMPTLYKRVNIVTVSPSTLNELRELGFDDKNIFLSFNAVSARVPVGVKKYKFPALLYVGRLKAYKRLEVAVRALKKLSKKYRGVKLYIAGAGDYEIQLLNFIKSFGSADNISMLGFVSERKKLELLKRSWVFLMPSMKEGWGITVTEAALCGTPSVGFNVPGIRDSIKNNETGFLAEDEKEFIMYADRLLSDKLLRDKMGEKSIVWAKNFSWETSKTVFEEVIRNTLIFDKGLLSERLYPWTSFLYYI
ncbi:glycosyltransferase [Patescibacteria group bacterium]|nr:glycosyltransferase [Patescibacteria group bacterium]